MKIGDEWVTYKMADGDEIFGEYAWVTELDFFDDGDEPVELIKETWQLVRSETLTYPEREPIDDEDEEEMAR